MACINTSRCHEERGSAIPTTYNPLPASRANTQTPESVAIHTCTQQAVPSAKWYRLTLHAATYQGNG